MSPLNTSMALAQMCRHVLEALTRLPLAQRHLLARARQAFRQSSVEETRLQLACIAREAYYSEKREVFPLFRELYDEFSSFTEQLGPQVPMEERRNHFEQFKAWLFAPARGEQEPQQAA